MVGNHESSPVPQPERLPNGIVLVRKVTEGYVLQQWGIGEAQNKERWGNLRSLMVEPATLLPKIDARTTAERIEDVFSEEELRAAQNGIQLFRARDMNPFLTLPEGEWYECRVSLEAIKQAKIMNWKPFVDIAGSRNLVDLARGLSGGGYSPDDKPFADNVEAIYQAGFDPAKMVSTPLLITEKGKESEIFLLEAYSRMCAMFRSVDEGKFQYPEEGLTFYIGIVPQLSEWGLMRFPSDEEHPRRPVISDWKA